MALILNLGCGVKTSDQTVNIDWTLYLRIAKSALLSRLAKRILSPLRIENIRRVGENTRLHDLRKGIPYPDNSVDAIYHSHLLEHIDRDLQNPRDDPAMVFTRECLRVLKPGGVLRIVVPDMEKRCTDYVNDIARCEADPTHWAERDRHIELIIGQAAMRKLPGTASERPLVRWIEMALLGDARDRGQTHQWEYDRFNLAFLLKQCGFSVVTHMNYCTSAIQNWNEIGLDRRGDGGEYKPSSLYMEATK